MNIFSEIWNFAKGLRSDVLKSADYIKSDTNGLFAIGTAGNLTGTTNQITLSASGLKALIGNSIQLSLPQDIATNSNVQFGKLGLGVAPSYQLHIKNTGNEAHNIRIEALSDTKILHDISTDENGNAIYELYDYTGAKKIHINGGSSSYFLNALGIGTSTPKSNFHLNGTTGTYFQFTNTATGQASASDGTLIGLDTNGVFEINQKENLSVKLYTNNILRQEIEAAGNVNFYENTGARKGVIWDATNQYLYLKQVGTDATSTATQKSSSTLYFETSNWTGSAETKSNFKMFSTASTSSNNVNTLYLNYNTTNIWQIGGAPVMIQFKVQTRIENYSEYRINNTLILRNYNNTIGNGCGLGFQNNGYKNTFSIISINKSHDANTGYSDLSFYGCPSGGSLTELINITSNGILDFKNVSSNVTIGTTSVPVYANYYQNVVIGNSSSVNTGSTPSVDNVVIGYQASCSCGYQSVVIGSMAGNSGAALGANNVFIGYLAGYTEANSNRLHIGSNPLIYGEFDNKMVRINGSLYVGDLGGYIMNITDTGHIQPVSSDDSNAPNNSIYYSTDQTKLSYKDSSGTVHTLY